jgi:histone H3/H4
MFALNGKDILFLSRAVEVLQKATEFYLVTVFEAANLLAFHANRVIIIMKDIRFYLYLFKLK